MPSYAKVPATQLTPLALTSTRNLLEAVRDPDTDPIRADGHFRVLGETRLSEGIAADEMLQSWRILLEVAREQAHPAAGRLGVGDEVLLDFVEATLRWGDRGMSKSAAAYREAEIGELERLPAEKDALRRHPLTRIGLATAELSPSSRACASSAPQAGAGSASCTRSAAAGR